MLVMTQIDKEGAQPERVKQELAENQLLPEEWGGETAVVPVSLLPHTHRVAPDAFSGPASREASGKQSERSMTCSRSLCSCATTIGTLVVSVCACSDNACALVLQISAKKGTGVDDLLEQLLLVAEVGAVLAAMSVFLQRHCGVRAPPWTSAWQADIRVDVSSV